MTNQNELWIDGYKFKFIDGKPAIVTAGTDQVAYLTLEELGYISEFVAEAWLALTDDDYKPVPITERGYVADAGSVTFATALEQEEFISDVAQMERDCE